MRLAARVCLAVALSGAPAEACSIVEIVVPPKSASRSFRVVVLVDGQPQPNARVELSMGDTQEPMVHETDSLGVVSFRQVPAGVHCITASAKPGTDALCLKVATGWWRTNQFTMTLKAKPRGSQTPEEVLASLEESPAAFRVSSFAGAVHDPSGAVIPGAKVSVFRHGENKSRPLVRQTADELGRFAAGLERGSYTLVVSRAGFRTEFVSFEVTTDASARELYVKMELGGCP